MILLFRELQLLRHLEKQDKELAEKYDVHRQEKTNLVYKVCCALCESSPSLFSPPLLFIFFWICSLKVL